MASTCANPKPWLAARGQPTAVVAAPESEVLQHTSMRLLGAVARDEREGCASLAEEARLMGKVPPPEKRVRQSPGSCGRTAKRDVDPKNATLLRELEESSVTGAVREDEHDLTTATCPALIRLPGENVLIGSRIVLQHGRNRHCIRHQD